MNMPTDLGILGLLRLGILLDHTPEWPYHKYLLQEQHDHKTDPMAVGSNLCLMRIWELQLGNNMHHAELRAAGRLG